MRTQVGVSLSSVGESREYRHVVEIFSADCMKMTAAIIRSELHEATVVTGDRLSKRIQDALDAYPISQYLTLLGETDPVGSYKYRSKSLMTYCDRLRRSYPQEVTSYNAVVVLELIRRSLDAIDSLDLPEEVTELCIANFARIVSNVQASDIVHMDFPNDRFDKELAAASMRLICAGARKLNEVYLPIAFARSNPYSWIKCVSRIGLRGTLYRMHMDSNDPALLADFNEDGWRRFCRRTAELLQRRSVQGILGAGWLYDPALKDVSPHLSYLGRWRWSTGASASDWARATAILRTPFGLPDRDGACMRVTSTYRWLTH